MQHAPLNSLVFSVILPTNPFFLHPLPLESLLLFLALTGAYLHLRIQVMYLMTCIHNARSVFSPLPPTFRDYSSTLVGLSGVTMNERQGSRVPDACIKRFITCAMLSLYSLPLPRTSERTNSREYKGKPLLQIISKGKIFSSP